VEYLGHGWPRERDLSHDKCVDARGFDRSEILTHIDADIFVETVKSGSYVLP
jgi:hypothetical protein